MNAQEPQDMGAKPKSGGNGKQNHQHAVNAITRQGQLSVPTAAVTKRLGHTAMKQWHNPSSNISNIVHGDDD